MGAMDARTADLPGPSYLPFIAHQVPACAYFVHLQSAWSIWKLLDSLYRRLGALPQRTIEPLSLLVPLLYAVQWAREPLPQTTRVECATGQISGVLELPILPGCSFNLCIMCNASDCKLDLR